MKKLYVGNLPFQATEEQVSALFTQTGVTAANVTLVRDRFSGQPRGFGFVEVNSDEEADRAVQALNGHDFMGRNIVVNEARPPREGGGGGVGDPAVAAAAVAAMAVAAAGDRAAAVVDDRAEAAAVAAVVAAGTVAIAAVTAVAEAAGAGSSLPQARLKTDRGVRRGGFPGFIFRPFLCCRISSFILCFP